jgi:hypothetical protein
MEFGSVGSRVCAVQLIIPFGYCLVIQELHSSIFKFIFRSKFIHFTRSTGEEIGALYFVEIEFLGFCFP